MGGKENYAEQTYLLAVTALVFSTFYFPLTVLLEFVPPEAMFLLCLLHLPMAAFAVYSILVLYQMVKAIHPLSTGRTLLALVAYIIGIWVVSAVSFMLGSLLSL